MSFFVTYLLAWSLAKQFVGLKQKFSIASDFKQ